MRIESSEIAFQSTHERRDLVSERVVMQLRPMPASAPRPDTQTLSERAIAASATPSPISAEAMPPRLALIRQVLEDLFGMRIELYELDTATAEASDQPPGDAATPEDAPADVPRGGAFELHRLRTREASERLSVQAQGQVRTADGRQISLDLRLELQRDFRQTELVIVRGESEAPRRKDPLVINLDGGVAAFESTRIAFDLDADGVAEHIPNVTAASGYLALDRNGNGRIDDGRELFGARSGNGFAELAALDDDANGWIDESDAAWSQLRIWRREAGDQDRLQTLAEAGVGALHLGAVQGDFEYRDADQTPIAEVKATGLYLKESGVAGTLQQLDFFV